MGERNEGQYGGADQERRRRGALTVLVFKPQAVGVIEYERVVAKRQSTISRRRSIHKWQPFLLSLYGWDTVIVISLLFGWSTIGLGAHKLFPYYFQILHSLYVWIVIATPFFCFPCMAGAQLGGVDFVDCFERSICVQWRRVRRTNSHLIVKMRKIFWRWFGSWFVQDGSWK